jgi:hypothetical protein
MKTVEQTKKFNDIFCTSLRVMFRNDRVLVVQCEFTIHVTTTANTNGRPIRVLIDLSDTG